MNAFREQIEALRQQRDLYLKMGVDIHARTQFRLVMISPNGIPTGLIISEPLYTEASKESLRLISEMVGRIDQIIMNLQIEFIKQRDGE